MPIQYTRGNAVADGTRGWFVGQFIAPEGGLRRRSDVELKWGIHPKGEERPGAWGSYRVSTTIAVLICGEILIRLRDGDRHHEIPLEQPGDYLIIPPGIPHNWCAVTDCTVLTVRTPSVAGDAVSHHD